MFAMTLIFKGERGLNDTASSNIKALYILNYDSSKRKLVIFHFAYTIPLKAK